MAVPNGIPTGPPAPKSVSAASRVGALAGLKKSLADSGPGWRWRPAGPPTRRAARCGELPAPDARGDPVAGGEEDPAGPVRHQSRAALPDARLVVGHPRLVGPQGEGARREVDARHVPGVGLLVAVRGERPVDPPVKQQGAGPLALVLGVEGEVGVVARVSPDQDLRGDVPVGGVDPEQVEPRVAVGVERVGEEVHVPAAGVVDRGAGHPDFGVRSPQLASFGTGDLVMFQAVPRWVDQFTAPVAASSP